MTVETIRRDYGELAALCWTPNTITESALPILARRNVVIARSGEFSAELTLHRQPAGGYVWFSQSALTPLAYGLSSAMATASLERQFPVGGTLRLTRQWRD